MRKAIITALLFIPFINAVAQKPPSATQVLDEACKQAAKENKKVMIIFHASWCTWCHRMDSSMQDPACKKLFDDRFVVRHLVVSESKGKENLENPGGEEMKNKYNGNDMGIPYWLIFDSNKKLLSDARMRKEGDGQEAGDNVGCPATEKEVEYFLNVLRKTTDLNEHQLTVIANRFRQNDR